MRTRRERLVAWEIFKLDQELRAAMRYDPDLYGPPEYEPPEPEQGDDWFDLVADEYAERERQREWLAQNAWADELVDDDE